MIKPTIRQALRACANQLTQAKRELDVSIRIDRQILSDSRGAIDSSRALLRRIGRQEAG